MSLVPPAITILSRILKDEGVTVKLFDTTYYQGDEQKDDSDKHNMLDLVTRPFDTGSRIKLKSENVFEDFNRMVEEYRPDLIALSAEESTVLFGIRLLRAVRHHCILTILGGVFATFAPQRAISFPEIDIVCVGEGETALIQLCDRLRRGLDYSAVPNLWIKKEDGEVMRNPIAPVRNIEFDPVPDVNITEENRHYRPMSGRIYKMFLVETHRGCPFACGFCNSPAYNRMYRLQAGCNFLRKRSLKKIHEELLYYRDSLKAEYIFFWADTFFAYSQSEVAEFCSMYSDVRLPFYCNAHPCTVTRDKVKRLKEVGLHRVGMGIEHGNEKFRREVVNRHYSNQAVIDSANILNEFAVPFSVNNIIGFPDETYDLAMDTIELNRKINASDTSCSIFQPFYGTSLRELAVKRGYIKPDVLAHTNTEDSLLEMPFFTKEKIRGLRRTFVMYTRFPKEQWNQIRLAEKLTPEGDAQWLKLREEFIVRYFT
jgi:radical SAM superfamily enzyme YgiQ (UPF0313 family)